MNRCDNLASPTGFAMSHMSMTSSDLGADERLRHHHFHLLC